jgi:hypothetical protein
VVDGSGVGEKVAHVGIGGTGGELIEHVTEVRPRVETVPCRAAAHAREHRCGLQPAVTTYVQPVRSPHPAWLAWNVGAVRRLTEAAYEERELSSGHLSPARRALVADALEDAGCADAEILGHLRSARPHVRGCWPLDLLTGRS